MPVLFINLLIAQRSALSKTGTFPLKNRQRLFKPLSCEMPIIYRTFGNREIKVFSKWMQVLGQTNREKLTNRITHVTTKI